MATDNNKRLQELGGSDFEIADGQPNIKGWDVRDASGKRIGEVEELIFDVQSQKVRYIVLDLEDNELDLDEKEVLVPIGLAQLNDEEDDVILQGITAAQLSSLPDYDEDQLDAGYESKIRNVFAGAGATAALSAAGAQHDDSFYQHEHFNDQNLYRNRQGATDSRQNSGKENEGNIQVVKEELNVGKREIETGGVRLRSRVVEEEATQQVSLRDETVHVDRTAVDRPAQEGDLRNQDIEVREHDEVPVVNKEARVVEEIRLSKDVDERDETIRDTVRNTEVDIDRNNDGTQRNNRTGNENNLRPTDL